MSVVSGLGASEPAFVCISTNMTDRKVKVHAVCTCQDMSGGWGHRVLHRHRGVRLMKEVT